MLKDTATNTIGSRACAPVKSMIWLTNQGSYMPPTLSPINMMELSQAVNFYGLPGQGETSWVESRHAKYLKWDEPF
jgi:hypothetical protein